MPRFFLPGLFPGLECQHQVKLLGSGIVIY